MITNPDLEKVLNTERYELLELAGRGCWGEVYKARDLVLGDICAIKVLNPTEIAKKQMIERNLTEQTAMKKEANLKPGAYIVPRSFEVDLKGKHFIVMPFYERFLSDILMDKKDIYHRNCVGRNLTKPQAISYLVNIARGLDEMHRLRRTAHGDLKPDNIAIDENKQCLINDLGTSTLASYGRSDSPRDNMGFVDTRAPELFKKESHPDTRSDNYAWAAIAFRMFHGAYPSTFYPSNDPYHDNWEYQEEHIKEAISVHVPKHLQEIVLRNLNHNPWKRNYNGTCLKEDLEKAVQGHGKFEEFKEYTRKFGLSLGLPALGLGAIFSLAGYSMYTYEPPVDDRPPVRITGFLNPGNSSENQLNFQSEEIKSLPNTASGLAFYGFSNVARRLTDNRDLAYLMKTYVYASNCSASRISDYQSPIYNEIETEIRKDPRGKVGASWYTWKKVIEEAIEHCKKPDNSIDLEDLMVTARLGPGKVDELKSKAGSSDYQVYREHIPKKERQFIDQWLSYFHNDID